MAFQDLVKHPLWFDDGSIVIIVENTGFRVHRTLLASHSEVFRQMFSLPQPETPAEGLIEDCSIVRLAQDRVQDISVILSILYDPTLR